MVSRPNTEANRYRFMRRVVILALVLTGFLFLWPSIKYSIAVVKMYRPQSAITIGLTLHEIDTNDIPNLNLNIWEKQYLARHEVPLSLVSLDYIYVPKYLVSDDDSLCIAEIKIFSDSTLRTLGDVIYLVNENTGKQNICLGGGKNVILPEQFQIAPIVYSEYSPPFFYPFDVRTINYSLSSRLYFKSTGKNLDAKTEILMLVSPPRWIPNTNIISRSEDENGLNLRTSITRFPLAMFLSIIVPFGVLSIIYMLPGIRNEIGSFWEVIVGLIVGLWGLSGVLIPSYIDYPTIIETIILFLYVIIGLFVIVSVVRQISQRNSPIVDLPPPIGEVPDNTSIENLYAWAIGKLNDGIDSVKIAEALFVKARDARPATYKKKLIEVGEKFIKT